MKRNKKNFKVPPLKLDLSPETKKSIWGIFFFFLGIFVILSLLNLGGKAGSTSSQILILLFGKSAWFFPFLFFIIGLVFFSSKTPSPYPSAIIGGILFLVSILSILELFEEKLGGYAGKIFAFLPKEFLGTTASSVFFIALFLISISFLFNIPIFKKLALLRQKTKNKEEKPPKLKEGKIDLRIKDISPQKSLTEKLYSILPKVKGSKNGSREDAILEENKIKKGQKYKILPLNLLSKEESFAVAGNLRVNAQIIKRTLKNFGIEVEMGEINVGPTVTEYTLKPAEGVKVSKITALQNDLSLALASHPIRIEAPIPGKSLIGVEVPNQKRAKVKLANLLSFPQFASLPILGFPLGKDVMGNPCFANIGSMPHLLVAGSTGAGKTVFLNSLILSLLWRNSPEDVRFILIDPKRVEFTFYDSISHLLCPPIISHQKVIPVLKWLIKEMEERFEILHDARKRDIASYNDFVFRHQKPKTNEQKNEEEHHQFEKLPYILLIIDELADIIAAKGKEFEALIVRLSQMSRAVGIHLVLATQRPSVEVLTGLIKANITSRIAFQVATQIDSRTILDMAGAERLLGKGDMLFLSGEASKPKRIQSPFVSAEETKKVVEYIKENEEKSEKETKIEESLSETLENTEESKSFEVIDSDDELVEEAKRVVIQARKASASLLQRRLRIGYARAARILDILQEKGIIGPPDGAKPREVYIKEPENNNIKNSELEDLNPVDDINNDKIS